ncbi:MAG TPA: thioredoxin domain-containing protein, partial [Rhizomicrobium sp.]|nr:thioredoxin domain-containing protein [Rhizomicrobium sp.]
DREERPDIDQLYQTAASAMGHQGGWPLTMFLTPKGEPFVAGGYFPKDDRANQASFKRILPEVTRVFSEQSEPVANTVARVRGTLAQLWARDLKGPLDSTSVDIVAVKCAQRYDIFYGGMTGAPKFATTGLTEMLWRGYLRTGAQQFAQLVQTTLDNICLGGLYDHVGGGFYRYCIDERWFIPHFEKMLYDNALLIDLLTLVCQHNNILHYADRVFETVGWVLRELTAGDAFASSIDADSDGEEGRYYTWSEAEIDAALVGTFAQRFKDAYGVRREGAFNGRNILHRFGRLPFPLPEADEALLKKQRELLLAVRLKRTAPIRDDKVLADWNGLMIAALVHAGSVFRKPDWIMRAVKAFEFIVRTLGDGDRLHHSWRAGKCGYAGFVEDYVQMARAALALWEVTGEKHYLDKAQAWVRVLDQHFWDSTHGGYFFTADDSDPLMFPARMIFDQNTPSGNGTMVGLLAQLHLITAEQSYRERGNALIEAFSGEVGRAFLSMGTYMNGLDTTLAGFEVVILGPRSHPKTQELIATVLGRSLPNRVLHVTDSGEALPANHPAHAKLQENGLPTAYICQRSTCSAPISNPVTLSQVLQLPPARVQGRA